jgi:hypothetical protein
MDYLTNPFGPPRPWQFGLKWLFALTAFVATVFGIVHRIGPGATVLGTLVLLAGSVGYVLPGSKSEKWGRAVMVCCTSGAVLLVIIYPALQEGTPRPRSACNNNLKQIGLGLQTYAEFYGCLPPAYISDATAQTTAPRLGSRQPTSLWLARKLFGL